MQISADSESYRCLDSDGIFHQSLNGFTPRESQCEMAESVERCLVDCGQLVVESGTGTGKTFAYLVPIVLQGKRSIISTATKHLQEQIFNRDLPVVSQTLGRPLDAVLLKGRSNYLCRYRLEQEIFWGLLIPFVIPPTCLSHKGSIIF
ncbi:MAG: DEAD/DEAH box helicase, partial [Pseudomonadota bacterium]